MPLSIGGSTRHKLQLPVTCISTRVDISCCRGQSWSPHRTSIYIYDVLQLKLIKGKGEPSSANYTRHRRSSVTLRTGKGDSEAWTVAMKALLLKTGSFTTRSPVFTASMGVALSRQNTFPGVFSGERTTAGSPRLTLHLDVNRRNGGIRRALSESDMIKSVGTFPGARSLSSTSRVPDEVHVDPGDEPSLTLEGNFEETWKRSRILVEEVGFCGSGFGDGSESGGYHGSGGGSGGSRRKMGDYYLAMLKSNPGDPLLLRNYGKYLHEVSAGSASSIKLLFPFPVESDFNLLITAG